MNNKQNNKYVDKSERFVSIVLGRHVSSSIFLQHIIGIILFITASYIVYRLSQYNYPIYHSLIEIFTVIVSCSIFIIVIHANRFLSNHYLLVIGIYSIFISIIDLLHVFAYKGAEILRIAEISQTNLATQLWVTDRILFGISLIIAPIYFYKKARPQYIFWSAFVLTASILLSIFYWKIFPAAYIDGVGLTNFKKIAEYGVTSIIFISAVLLILNRNVFNKKISTLIVISLLLSAVSEIFFTLYTDVYGPFNFTGHLLRFLSYYLMYRAITVTSLVQPFDILFRELKLNEERLRVQSEMLQREKDEDEALLSSIGDGIIATDNRGMILYVNYALLKMLRLEERNVIGEKFENVVTLREENAKIISYKNRPLGKVLLNKSRKKIVIKSTDYYVSLENGERVYLSITATPIYSKNKIIGSLAVYHDITDEKEFEQSKLEFISFAAHQLRTPLTTISLTAETAKSLLTEGRSDESQQLLVDISNEVGEMSKILDMFLDVSRIEMGLIAIHNRQEDVSLIVDTSIRDFEAIAGTNKIKIVKNYCNNILINTDKNIVRIIMNNLLSNALKYTDKGGEIKVGIESLSNSVVISVSDTGCGIPDNQQNKIFEKLFRASNVRDKKGVGLGLYITKSALKQLGGQIWFETSTTAKSHGTTFFFSLPLPLRLETSKGSYSASSSATTKA